MKIEKWQNIVKQFNAGDRVPKWVKKMKTKTILVRNRRSPIIDQFYSWLI